MFEANVELLYVTASTRRFMLILDTVSQNLKNTQKAYTKSPDHQYQKIQIFCNIFI